MANYYKDDSENLYVDPIVNNHDSLVKLTEDEFNALLEEKNTLTDDEVNAQNITTSKIYLTSTDWVVVKINESSIQGEDITDLLTKYADVLTARIEARDNINSLEK